MKDIFTKNPNLKREPNRYAAELPSILNANLYYNCSNLSTRFRSVSSLIFSVKTT